MSKTCLCTGQNDEGHQWKSRGECLDWERCCLFLHNTHHVSQTATCTIALSAKVFSSLFSISTFLPRHVQSAAPGDVSGPIMRNTCWLTQIENTTRRGREELLPACGQLMSPHLPITTTLTERFISRKIFRAKNPLFLQSWQFYSVRDSDVRLCLINSL